MQGFTYIDLSSFWSCIWQLYCLRVFIFAKKEMKGERIFLKEMEPFRGGLHRGVSIFATLLSLISFLSLAGNSYAGTWIMWFAQLGMLLAIPLQLSFSFQFTANWILIQHIIIWNCGLAAKGFVFWEQ